MHPLTKHNNAQYNGVSMFSGRAWLGPTARRTYSTRETPALSDSRVRALKKVGQKGGDELE